MGNKGDKGKFAGLAPITPEEEELIFKKQWRCETKEEVYFVKLYIQLLANLDARRVYRMHRENYN